MKLTDRGQAARKGRGAEGLRAARREIPLKVARACFERVRALRAEIGFIVGEIAPVRADCTPIPARCLPMGAD